MALAGPAPAPREGADDTSSRILDAAEHLFRTLGYEKTTVGDIAKATDMSPANIYRFFHNKADIVSQIADRWLSRLDEDLARVAARPGTAEERLHRFALAAHRDARAQFIHERKVHELCALVINEHWPVVQRHIERYDATAEAILADGVATGEFQVADLPATARLIRTAMVKFIHPMMIASCVDDDLAHEVEALVDLLLAGLKPRDRRRPV